MKRRFAVVAVALAGLGVTPALAQAGGVGPNASFQNGNFSHWHESTAVCSSLTSAPALAEFDTFAIPFTLDPEFGGSSVPSPPGGHAAIFDQSGPSWGVVDRTFRVPPKARRLSFKVWWRNLASSAPYWSAGKSIGCPASIGPQMIYVDLLKPSAKATSIKKSDRIRTLWRTSLSTPTSGGWKTLSYSVRKLRGKQVKFRLGAQSTLNWLNVALTGLKVK